MRQDQTESKAQQNQQDSSRDEIDRLKGNVRAPFGTPTILKTASCTAKMGEYTRVDPSAAAIAVELPRATSVNIGQTVTVKNASASTNTITINGGASDTIDGGVAVSGTTAWKARVFLCAEIGKWDEI